MNDMTPKDVVYKTIDVNNVSDLEAFIKYKRSEYLDAGEDITRIAISESKYGFCLIFYRAITEQELEQIRLKKEEELKRKKLIQEALRLAEEEKLKKAEERKAKASEAAKRGWLKRRVTRAAQIKALEEAKQIYEKKLLEQKAKRDLARQKRKEEKAKELSTKRFLDQILREKD